MSKKNLKGPLSLKPTTVGWASKNTLNQVVSQDIKNSFEKAHLDANLISFTTQ